MTEVVNVIKEEDYLLLKDLRLEIPTEKIGTTTSASSCFSLCFWFYPVNNSTSFPATIIKQVHSGITNDLPFLVLDESKKLKLLPLLFLHKEAPDPSEPSSWENVPYASTDTEFPLGKWVHVGCEVSFDFVRLHINGKLVGEKPLSSSLGCDTSSDILKKIILVGNGGNDDIVKGYIHEAEVLFLRSSIKEHYFKDSPLQLSVDTSSASEIEEYNDGVWSIVGGKASCRRNFSLDVVLLNFFGHPSNKEMEIVASLLYFDNGAPVEKTYDAEAALLTTYDGIEFTSEDRPSKLVHGRASFKLKISQLSSKCDNRLFRIKFLMPKVGKYPFFEAFSLPIRCISRSRNTRTPTETLKKFSSAIHLCNGFQSSELVNEFSENQQNAVDEATVAPPSKRARSGQENLPTTKAVPTSVQPDEECHSHGRVNSQAENASATSPEGRPESLEETDNSQTDSDSTRNSDFQSLSASRNQISDITVFKYCLGGLNERAFLLKELANCASDEELAEFARQVSLYTGCSHHRNQILIAKKLIEDGTKVWNAISQNSDLVHWDNAMSEIEEQFMKIACCSTRSLSEQDFECLRKIAGSREYMGREDFEKMWCWLYPVAFTLSRAWINTLWGSTSPKWIEGFITKEEAEFSLQGPSGFQEPGTFVLRFPMSRSWPHPDAGNLVVTYVGCDYSLHHRLLSLDFLHSSDNRERNVKPLQYMLLEEPELSRLGRIIRSH